MKFLFLSIFIVSINFASLIDIKSFEADFKQIITDEKGEKLTYNGHIMATSPQYAVWKYTSPIEKTMYIKPNLITIVEPELEQVIIKKIPSYFDFFTIMKHATKISSIRYETFVKDVKYTIYTEKELIKSVSYYDEFENFVQIIFEKQVQNREFSKVVFQASYPDDYDVISE